MEAFKKIIRVIIHPLYLLVVWLHDTICACKEDEHDE